MTNPCVWFEVTGRDPATLRSFYSQLFGWRIRSGDQAAALEYSLVEPAKRGVPGGIGSVPGGGCGQATFYVDVCDPTSFLARAEELGGRTVEPVSEIPGIRLPFAQFADPEGNIVGLVNAAGRDLEGWTWETGAGPCASQNPVLSFEVMGRDPKALRGFYGELFGWGFRRASAFEYWTVDSGDRGVVGGIGPTAIAGRRPLGGFATFKVEVVDPQTILAGAEELGGRTVMPATSVPGTDFKIAYFADPEGHVIGLTKGMA